MNEPFFSAVACLFCPGNLLQKNGKEGEAHNLHNKAPTVDPNLSQSLYNQGAAFHSQVSPSIPLAPCTLLTAYLFILGPYWGSHRLLYQGT
jgi:hypothetical protein